MRLPRPGQRFVAPQGAPPKAPVGVSACVSPAQDNVSWPHRELHRMRYSQRRYSQLHMVGSFVRLISCSFFCLFSRATPPTLPGRHKRISVVADFNRIPVVGDHKRIPFAEDFNRIPFVGDYKRIPSVAGYNRISFVEGFHWFLLTHVRCFL